jgi:hypothetical protein
VYGSHDYKIFSASKPSGLIVSQFSPDRTLLLIRPYRPLLRSRARLRQSIVRRLNLDVDLGQSISTIDMDMRQVLIQTRLTQLSSRFSLRVNQVNVTATGNVSGRADVVDFVFRTTRMTESAMDNASGQHQMLKLDITSGALNMVVESEHQKLLEYR